MQYPKCPFCAELARIILKTGESHPYWKAYQAWLAKVAVWESWYASEIEKRADY
jgi:hypothetical protein